MKTMNRHPYGQNTRRRCQLPGTEKHDESAPQIFPARTGFALGSHAGEWAYPDFFN
jgi:hypothetical protein